MTKYTIYGSELTASRGNEYETKSLLYLVSMHKESKKMVYYVVDVFNDVSGMSEDGEFIVDVQSKAHKTMSPTQLGERLVTLFKNYISEFKFDDYILVVSTLLSKKHLTNIELNQREFDLISLINDNALQLCKKGLKDKIKTYGIFENMSILKDEEKLDDIINSFIKNVHIFLANQPKSTYIKNILGDTDYQNDELFLEIFNEISKNQIFKKSYNNVENMVIHSPRDVLDFKRHLSYGQIQVLICKRIIDNDYIANSTAIPASFAVYLALKGIIGEEQREIALKCKDEIIVCMFNKNNQELFWEGFMNIFSTLKKLENYDDLDDCYNHLNENDFDKILLNNKNYYTRIYLLSMIIEGVKMIKIKTIAIGNNEEAFIEDNFKDGINIIYSNKNNRGKSILIQSIMYAIGNEPVFPTKPKAFYYKNYYFYLDIEINDKQYYFLRKDNTICILYEDNLILKESIDAFSDFFDKNIEKLPFFKKNKKDEICRASIELFYLSFFLGSDRKSTSDLPSSVIKRFNKRDFENMLCGMKVDMKSLEESYKKIEEKKDILSKLKQDMKVIDIKRKKIKEFKKLNPHTFLIVQKMNLMSIKKYRKISIDINEKEKEKKRIQNKIFKKEGVIAQIKSIERDVEVGFLFCEDCKSRNIRYSLSKRGASFDITNAKTRTKILDNLRNDIAQLNEKLEALDETIGIEQVNLDKYMARNNNITTNDFLFFSDDIKESVKHNEEYLVIIKKIDKLKEEIKKINDLLNGKEKEIKKIKNDLENKLRDEYFKVDNKIEGELDGLFTKIHESFSGSQALFFLYARIMAIIKYFDLEWPIIIDSIRDGEVDTLKEDILLKQFKSIENQVILSATLKDSEYKEEKYIKMDNINPIDYSDIPENTLLRPQYVEDFKKLVDKFNIKI